MTDIIFIGAGPVGLLAAIQLKLQFPKKEILMFEKYEKPTRNHAMYVEQSSFAGMDGSLGFGDLLKNIPTKVVISDLENTLRDYAKSIGIKIKFQEITNFKALESQYPHTKYFVGSGGLRGLLHPQVFNNENQISEPLRYAVEVKYRAKGAARSLNKLTELPGVLAHTNHLVSEYVGRLKEGYTPISLRIFIGESEYQAMKTATFKNPFTLADANKIPPALFKTITTYLNGRKHLVSETIQENSLKISSITLSLYASKDFCKRVDGKTFFQIGEEGFACPFYRSFNDNASCVPFFTRAMKAEFEGQQIAGNKFSSSPSSSSTSSSLLSLSAYELDPLEYYQESVQGLVNSEIRTVHLLNTGIGMLESSVATSQAVPQISGSKLRLKRGGKTFLDEEYKRSHPTDKTENTSWSNCALM